MPRDWDAATYDRIADPQFRWGAAVVGWLELEGDETVLDAGCGSGRVTELLLEPLPLGEPVDAILSTATFHWVADHEALFRNLAAVLRPSGQLAAQCGGAGNLATVVTALLDLGADPFSAKVFATPQETRDRLRTAGFTDIECWLDEEPTPFETEQRLETFLRTCALGDQVSAMTEAETSAFVHEVATRLPALGLDYVRLNIRARLA